MLADKLGATKCRTAGYALICYAERAIKERQEEVEGEVQEVQVRPCENRKWLSQRPTKNTNTNTNKSTKSGHVFVYKLQY